VNDRPEPHHLEPTKQPPSDPEGRGHVANVLNRENDAREEEADRDAGEQECR
jgi:hypothetical protein